MKVVFSFVCAAALLATLAGGASRAEAETTYFTTRGVLKEFFPNSDKVTYQRFTPTKAERKALNKRLGYRLAKKSYVFYVAKTGDKVDGYAFVGDELGQHLPITFAVKLSASGEVLRQEIMVYREPRGDEVRDKRFRDQFKGKTVHDAIVANDDIDCVSGATISSHAIAVGVRRAVVLFDEAIASRIPVRVSWASEN